MGKNAVILGVSADIGGYICRRYLGDGYNVLGTYRKFSETVDELSQLKGLTLIQCDLNNNKDIKNLEEILDRKQYAWSTLFSSVGTSEPIGRFFDLDFEDWEKSVYTNSLGQLRAIHALYKYRFKKAVSNIVLLAGGGTNNPFRCYSAYCMSKIMLIKMCELLDDENPDLNVFIVGPGFVRTKTHLETIKAGKHAENNYERVKNFWESGNVGTPMEKIYSCIRWLEREGRKVAGGRNFSVAHDEWGNEELRNELLKDLNMYKLRRSNNAWTAK